MGLQSVFSQAGSLMEGSLGIWFSCWALRYTFKWDYKLSTAAEVTRWAVVLGGYTLGVSLPTLALRLASGFTGLAFLCWPNFAYHLTSPFITWPVAEGRVESLKDDGSHASRRPAARILK